MEDPEVILREWRGRVPHDKTDAYLEFLDTRGTRGYATTPGHRGTWVLLDTESEPGVTEFTLLTLWESTESIKAFAGDDIGRAVYYPEDDDLLLEKPERLRHYTVVRAPAFAS